MQSVFALIHTILGLYVWLLIGSAVFSWLMAFNVVDARNRVVYLIGDFLHRATEPVLRPIRNILPNLGGIDISPVIVILAIILIQNLMREYGLVGIY